MSEDKQFTVLDLPRLEWPSALNVPTQRFRLLVAADTQDVSVDVISTFAIAALNAGMVYCCAWGRGCERLHDIVDECINEDDVGPKKFAGKSDNDVVMTTWHTNDNLEEALDFLATGAVPTDGFSEDSNFRVVLSVGHPEWQLTAQSFLSNAPFFI